ncbi:MULTISPECIES: hypothetical protein [unclassified Xanthobacter]|uniref:hypothetical protein n=1 Tax=unclassified Xanthobacter TaxID=2623496 RepID=UPI001F1A35E6|nr:MULTISPECIES: hypothetical protein [unclassified Xanthobacter]
MSIFNAEFTTGQVIAAADVTNSALQTWIKRGLIVGHKNHQIDMPGTPGIKRKFSFFNVMEIAIAKGLIDLGVELTDAFHHASMFAHTGDEERNPSLLFRDPGFTLLCVAGPKATEVLWMPGTDVTATIRTNLHHPLGWVTLEVNNVFDRVTTSLGYHPEAVLTECYGENN